MAFDNKNLSVMAYANAFTLWHYITEDSIQTIMDDPTYFGNVATLINKGDIIIFNCSNMVGFRMVTSSQGKKVTLAELN